MRFFISILFSVIFLLPFSVAAQHNHNHGEHTHDHRDDEHDEEESGNTDPDIALDLRLMTSQQVETGHSGFLLNLELEWRKTDLSIFAGLGSPREGQTLTGVSFTQGIEVEFNPVDEVAFHLGGIYHIAPFERDNATAGIVEGGLTIFPSGFLSLQLAGGLSGLSIETNDETVETTEEEDVEEHHHTFLLPAIHGGHPEHVEEGPPQWFISAEMRINLWRSP